MKLCLAHEIERQRSERTRELPLVQRLLEAALPARGRPQHRAPNRGWRGQPARAAAFRFTGRSIDGVFRRIAFHYRREAERQAREMREREREGGWER